MPLPSTPSLSILSVASSSDLRSWLCPFDSTTAATSEHHIDTHNKSGFIATCAEEASHVPAIRNGFQAYQDKLDKHKPFSQTFRDGEKISTTQAIQQLHDLSSVLQDLTIQATNLDDEEVVPEHLRADLHLASVWAQKHRGSLVSCHVFLKINHTLARDDPSDGVLQDTLEEPADAIVEMCGYAVEEHRRRASSIATAYGELFKC